MNPCSYSVTRQITPTKRWDISKEKVVQQSALLALPPEVLLNILNYLTPQQARTARPTCLKFDNLMGKLLCNKARLDFQNLTSSVAQIEKELTPRQGWLDEGKIIDFRKRTPTSHIAHKQLTNSLLCHKLKSFELYLLYLKQHAPFPHLEKEIEQVRVTSTIMYAQAKKSLKIVKIEKFIKKTQMVIVQILCLNQYYPA